MNELVDKLVTLESDISKEKGSFNLFALFLREDAEDKWDLLISAPWIEKDKKAAMKYIAELIQSRLNKSELVTLSRIVFIDKNQQELVAFQRTIHTEHNKVVVKNSDFLGLKIKAAFIITSKR